MNLTRTRVQFLFKSYLENKCYSPATVTRYKYNIQVFYDWFEKCQGKNDMRELTKQDVVGYQFFLTTELGKDRTGNRFSPSTQKSMINTLRVLYRFLSRNSYVMHNPFDNLDIDKIVVSQIPAEISEKDMKLFLDKLPLENPNDIRDKALFELMYATGLRVSEVAHLNVVDVDLKNGRLIIREGKGRKDRIVPLGKNVIKKYYIVFKTWT